MKWEAGGRMGPGSQRVLKNASSILRAWLGWYAPCVAIGFPRLPNRGA